MKKKRKRTFEEKKYGRNVANLDINCKQLANSACFFRLSQTCQNMPDPASPDPTSTPSQQKPEICLSPLPPLSEKIRNW